MKRYSNINEALNDTIELYSELETGKNYTIEGQEMKYYGVGPQGHSFTDTHGHDHDYSEQDLQQLIDAGDVKKVSNPDAGETLSDFPVLDRFTRQTFGVPTHDVLDLAGLNDTDKHTLESMIDRYGLDEMPLPGEGRYYDLINDEHWPVLKQYLKAISPDIDLPEELG